jgi:hypothetical protein
MRKRKYDPRDASEITFLAEAVYASEIANRINAELSKYPCSN